MLLMTIRQMNDIHHNSFFQKKLSFRLIAVILYFDSHHNSLYRRQLISLLKKNYFMQSIVAFTNSFSISAVNAVHYAGDMARALNVPLIILYAGAAENARHLNMFYDSVAEKTDNTVDIEIIKNTRRFTRASE